ncbi:hypothetical protein HYPSUDRAFT_960995 [Hypholoma sublateritium FD-334 SS-4]|uniref:Fungal-type protein kinase domain-containing protein n=1 Tax=Hypholoma sublateritium (strain FD-334 SS-4) TaxID=945553 RepID=A0A0D2PDP3_HYPSF|nr:hypothetical protein HYPSUDRAFT_960995 [Hypholoma sublateritium FD-334 SS-4]
MNIFQSYTATSAPCKPHDYMDDLESFFYVLCWILCGFVSPGGKLAELPRQLRKCASANPSDAFDAKLSALTHYFKISYPAAPYFGPVFDMLLGRLSCFSPTSTKNSSSRKVNQFQHSWN